MKPSWHCRNTADQKDLERWTREQLNDDPPNLRELPDDLYRELKMANNERFALWIGEDVGPKFKRVRVIAVVRRLQNIIGNDPELRLLARRLLLPRGSGRRKGERRPGNLTNQQRHACEAALNDVGRIRAIWRREFHKTNRSASPTALEIAARLHGLKEADLARYQKNRSPIRPA
jgi:hypothetical protein